MTEEEFNALFEKYKDDYILFKRVENKRSNRADLHAFLLLDELVPLDTAKPHSSDIVSAAEHDEIYLGIDCEVLREKITETQALELIRCGVRYDIDTDSLCMFA